MDNSSIYQNICANCGYEFQSELQTRTKQLSFKRNNSNRTSDMELDEDKKEMQIMDAIFYIFGLAFHDLYPENTDDINLGYVALCSDCTPLLKMLYESFNDLKQASASRKNSVLWNSVRWNRNRISIKNEFPMEDLGSGKTFGCLDFANTDAGNLKREFISSESYGCKEDLQMSQGFISDDISYGNDTNDDLPTYNHEPFPSYDHKTGKKFATNSSRRKQTIKSHFSEERKTTQKRHRTLKLKKGISKKGVSKKRIFKRIKAEEVENAERNLLWEVKHLDSLSGAAPIKCCDTHFQTDVEFASHMELIHGKDSVKPEEECRFCGKKILSKYMDFHVKVLHQKKLMVFECSLCKKSFLRRAHLRKHTNTKEHKDNKLSRVKKRDTQVFCEKCGKYFSYSYFRRYHSGMHDDNREHYQCEFCGKNLKSKMYLKTHIDFYHSTNNHKKFCDKCGKCCPNSKALYKHKKIHEADVATDKEKFKCTQCGITLKHTASLKKHMYQMHGQAALKTFSCELCGKTTKNMTNMRIHMKVHDPNRSMKQKTPNSMETNNNNTPFPFPPPVENNILISYVDLECKNFSSVPSFNS